MNSIRIAVCDDEKMVRRDLIKNLQRVLDKEQIQYEIYEFSCGVQLLERANDIQLLFLDMDMPEIDGIDVGRKMQEVNPRCKIIIASGREDRFKETYRLRPLRFVSKPFNEEELRDAVLAYKVGTIGIETVDVFLERRLYQIPQREIQYIAAFKGYVEVFANGILYRKDISLNKLEKNLVQDIFYKVHKSYIVNLFWLTEIHEKEVLIGNIRIPLSRRQGKDIRDIYMHFDVKYR